MSLTAERELALRDAKLIHFFEKNKSAFREIAIAAYQYTKDYVTQPVGARLRPDDVAGVLIPALHTNEPLRDFLAEGLKQQYWYRDFADLILDRLWEELEDEQEQQATGGQR